MAAHRPGEPSLHTNSLLRELVARAARCGGDEARLRALARSIEVPRGLYGPVSRDRDDPLWRHSCAIDDVDCGLRALREEGCGPTGHE